MRKLTAIIGKFSSGDVVDVSFPAAVARWDVVSFGGRGVGIVENPESRRTSFGTFEAQSADTLCSPCKLSAKMQMQRILVCAHRCGDGVQRALFVV